MLPTSSNAGSEEEIALVQIVVCALSKHNTSIIQCVNLELRHKPPSQKWEPIYVGIGSADCS